MVCFSWYGVEALRRIKGIMKKENYHQILIHQMRSSVTHFHGNDFIFQYDNDPKHTLNVVKNYLQNQGIEVYTSLVTSKPRFEPYWESVNCGPRLIDSFRNGNTNTKKSCSRVWRRNGSISMKIIFKSLWKACQTGVRKCYRAEGTLLTTILASCLLA